jgi:hypothetical protein
MPPPAIDGVHHSYSHGRAATRWLLGEGFLTHGVRAVRGVLLTMLAMLMLVGLQGVSDADGGVEQRIAEFWQRIDRMQSADLLAAGDLGQWALNVIERDASARITVADFRASTAAMQAAMERVRQAAPSAAAPAGVEQRIADFWKRLDAMQLTDNLASADLGQWALNVTLRDPSARIAVADFRTSTAAMQAAIERAGRAPAISTLPPSGGFDPRFYIGKGDAFNCAHFASQAMAQAVLRADSSDPNGLDSERDGLACESNPSPKDLVPVPR